MGHYVQNNIFRDENIVKKANFNKIYLIGPILWSCFVITIPWTVPKISRFNSMELAFTNKRVIGKCGVGKKQSLDAPLNKIQNVFVEQSFMGKILGYGTLTVNTAAGVFNFKYVNDVQSFKNNLFAQIDQYEKDMQKQQAAEIANAMNSVFNKQ